MHYQNVIIIRECSKKLLEMKNSKSFSPLTPSMNKSRANIFLHDCQRS